MSEDIFLNGYKKYLNLVIYERLADPVGVFYLTRSVGILNFVYWNCYLCPCPGFESSYTCIFFSSTVTGFDLWGAVVATGVVCTFYCTMAGATVKICKNQYGMGTDIIMDADP
ncbi:hypothetical protein J1605_020281 [Eschrichtius robustus]|uniref:Uncharacterized protein n=1 Tax=Eschrichtius robustus TaxID=9764 RepID=A0AB34HIX8_ESCRO|nr:hypothetical protein J1605_020281 [Eschrichtius robustus]